MSIIIKIVLYRIFQASMTLRKTLILSVYHLLIICWSINLLIDLKLDDIMGGASFNKNLGQEVIENNYFYIEWTDLTVIFRKCVHVIHVWIWLTLWPSWQEDPKSTILMADLLGLHSRIFSGFRSQWIIDSSGVARNNNAVDKARHHSDYKAQLVESSEQRTTDSKGGDQWFLNPLQSAFWRVFQPSGFSELYSIVFDLELS